MFTLDSWLWWRKNDSILLQRCGADRQTLRIHLTTARHISFNVYIVAIQCCTEREMKYEIIYERLTTTAEEFTFFVHQFNIFFYCTKVGALI